MKLDNLLRKVEKKPRIALITACGAKKRSQPMKAYKLYRSPRIKAIHNRRANTDMYILSAEYGLVGAHEEIEPYDRVMDEQRAQELVPFVAKKLKIYNYVIFFKGGARKAYLNCIRAACNKARKTLVTVGFANMGGINELPVIIDLLNNNQLKKIRNMQDKKIYIHQLGVPLDSSNRSIHDTMLAFEEVWQKVIKELPKYKSVRTLVQKIENKIINVNNNRIKIRSDKTGRIRSIPKRQFKQIWNTLISKGYYITKEHKPYVHSQIISAVYVLLGLTNVKYNPLTLYLSQKDE